MSGLRSICLNDADERLYIANSKRVAEMVIDFQMSDFYPTIFQDPELQQRIQTKAGLSAAELRLQKERQHERLLIV